MTQRELAARFPAANRVRLRALQPHDVAELYGQVTSPTEGFRWRYHGATPSPAQVSSSMWDGVLAQFAVSPVANNKLLGLVVLYNARFQDSWCYLGALALPAAQGTGEVVEGGYLMLEYAFTTWSFRKIYLETPQFNIPQIESLLDRFFQLEGRLRDHIFHDGRYWDLITHSISREQWQASQKREARYEAMSGILTQDELLSWIDSELSLSLSDADNPESVSLVDLGCDSLHLVTIATMLQDICEVDLDDNLELRSSFTLGQLYRLYLTAAQSPPKRPVT